MRLEDAETLLDGGTTCLTVLDGFEKLYITIDYSLPMDGRPRHIFIGKTHFTQDNQLEINSEREKQIVNWLKNELIAKFGEIRVQDFIEGKFDGSVKGKWLYALNFLRIISKERDYL
jgi:hypothetical protein